MENEMKMGSSNGYLIDISLLGLFRANKTNYCNKLPTGREGYPIHPNNEIPGILCRHHKVFR